MRATEINSGDNKMEKSVYHYTAISDWGITQIHIVLYKMMCVKKWKLANTLSKKLHNSTCKLKLCGTHCRESNNELKLQKWVLLSVTIFISSKSYCASQYHDSNPWNCQHKSTMGGQRHQQNYKGWKTNRMNCSPKPTFHSANSFQFKAFQGNLMPT